MGKGLYPKLAWQNIRRDGKFYLPYFLSIVGCVAGFYIVSALGSDRGLPMGNRYAYLSMFLGIGTWVIGLFALIFLTYTSRFLAKRRQRELGLYNILGMGKGHIALVLGFETVYLTLGGLLGGILAGCALQAGAVVLLGKLMHMDTKFHIAFSPQAAVVTAVWFGAIMGWNLLLNLHQIRAQRPVELLHSQSAGEREPKSRWLLALVGVVALGVGYGIALKTRTAIDALVLYFLAVFCVIIGTYCLFTAVSIVILKALRKNKRYYYQTGHMISVSGMLYRMKRNGVGLASICILCTMVLVMLSGTLALYVGSEQNLNKKFPGEVTVSAQYDPLGPAALDGEALDSRFGALTAEWGYAPQKIGEARYGDASFVAEDGLFREYDQPQVGKPMSTVTFLPYDSYTQLTGEEVAHDGRAHLYPARELDTLTLDFGGGNVLSYPVGDALTRAPEVVMALAYVSDEDIYVALPEEALAQISAAREAGLGERMGVTYCSYWNLGGDLSGQQTHLDAILEQDWSGVGSFSRLRMVSREGYGEDYYALNGGFFFLGLFLSLLFLMAAALIVYYKQASEGYEDAGRFQIMRNVGLEDRDIRRSVNGQMRVVCFAPLAVAAVHVAFDFPLVSQLLRLFGMVDRWLFLGATLAAFAAFVVVYFAVYKLTARVYYHLVR